MPGSPSSNNKQYLLFLSTDLSIVKIKNREYETNIFYFNIYIFSLIYIQCLLFTYRKMLLKSKL
jgi:hypothetical protein